jgi:hypothetical protein
MKYGYRIIFYNSSGIKKIFNKEIYDYWTEAKEYKDWIEKRLKISDTVLEIETVIVDTK